MRGVLVVSILFGCGGSAPKPVVLPTPPAEPIKDKLIAPGVRVGPVALGMSSTQLADTMGPPTRDSDGKPVWGTTESFMTVTIDEKDAARRVTEVWLFEDPSFATSEGVRIGDTTFTVKTKLGAPSSEDNSYKKFGVVQLEYCRGIRLQTNNGRVNGIAVYPPRC